MLQLKNAENGSDKVKTRKKKILMYKKVHEFSFIRRFDFR